MKHITVSLCLLVLSIFAASAADAQAVRTWVSGVGDDANPCSRTAPCKTFAGAISKTQAGGEIDTLDPGTYGAVTITKALTIDGGGGMAATITAGATNGITVSAGAGDLVTLRNLQIQGARQTATAGLTGIQLNSAGALRIEHCAISNFSLNGVNIAGGTAVFVNESTSSGNSGNGLNILAAASVRVSVADSHFSNNANGIVAGDNSITTVRNSDASGNGGAGFAAQGSSGNATLNLIDSTSTNNMASGVSAGGGGAAPSQVRLTNVTIASNIAGIVIGTNGAVLSFGNNHNTGTGAPSSVVAAQ